MQATNINHRYAQEKLVVKAIDQIKIASEKTNKTNESIIPLSLLPLTRRDIEILKIDARRENSAFETSKNKPVALKIKDGQVLLVFENKLEQVLSAETKKTFLANIQKYAPLALSVAELGIYGAIIGTNIAAGAVGLSILGLSFADPTGISLSITFLVLLTISLVLIGKKIYDRYKLVKAYNEFFKSPEITDKGKANINELILEIEKKKAFFNNEYRVAIKLAKINSEKEIIAIEEEIRGIKDRLSSLTDDVNYEEQKNKLEFEKKFLLKKLSELKQELKENNLKLNKVSGLNKNLENVKENLVNTIYRFQAEPKNLSLAEKELLTNLLGSEIVAKRVNLFALYNNKKLNLTPLNDYLEKINNDPKKIETLGQKISALKKRNLVNADLIKIINDAYLDNGALK